jgi:AraC-like DNA-binding protein
MTGGIADLTLRITRFLSACMAANQRRPAGIDRATVGAGYAKALFDFAVLQGVAAADLAACCRIDGARLNDPDGRISFARYIALMRCAKELSGDPALALRFGAATRITDLTIAGLIGAASETLLDAFVQMNRYARLTMDLTGQGDRMRLERAGAQAWIVVDFPEPALYPEVLESGFARMASYGTGSGPNPFVKAVHFTYRAPAHAEAYKAVFKVDVVFESARNAILTDAAWMSEPGPMKSKYVFAILCRRGDVLLDELERADTLRARIEALVLKQLHEGPPTIRTVAARLKISRATLFRRLRDEGLTFDRLIDGLRRRVALEYLAAGRVSVKDVAYLTGFSEAAAFSRAFRRWTGQSPKAFKAGQPVPRVTSP